ncbi:2-C-methyl-D-erythritol 4-phosphate cytidylyltransferase [Pseudothioglobus sp. nBUS_23]|uniref:2-C-methyl-D-erythritol 4-phosphate cytidylyltransferase n=1 Tax=Pseudothioglobus sp. nBUS_23 TaxID=3395318 RepID=UPI003EB7E079
MNKDKYFLVVPASGIGQRMNSTIPKQYIILENGLTILDQCLNTILSNDLISGFIVALDKKDSHFKSSDFAKDPKLISIATGGKERFHSVLNALNALDQTAKPNDWVLVHDAVRPCIRKEDINNLIEEVADDKVGGILANRIVDTVKQKNNGGLVSTIDRQKLYIAQTPQMFRYAILKDSIEKAIKSNMHITDESEALESLNYSIRIVEGSSSNIKITTQEDIHLANYFLKHHEY